MERNQKLIITSVHTNHIFEVHSNPGGRTTFSGFEGRFLQTILDFLGREYTFVPPREKEWGSQKDNGTWTGLIGMVQRGDADMAFNLVSMTESRRSAVDFSDMYAIEGSSFPIQKFDIPPSPLTLLNPFDIPTWIFFAVSLVVTSVTLNFVAFRGKGSLGYLCMVLMANVLNQTMDIGKRSKKTNLLMSFWYFLALMISLGYSAVLLAILSIPLQETPIKDYNELAEAIRKGTRGCTIVRGTTLLPYFLHAKDKDFQDIGRAIQRNKWFISSSKEEAEYIKKKFIVIKSTIITSTFSKDSILKSNTRWSDNIDTASLGIALKKGFCCKGRLNILLSRMRSSGLYGKFQRDQGLLRWLENPDNFKQVDQKKPLSLGDLSGAFIVLVVGYALSVGALLGEKCHSRRRKVRIRERKCRF